MHMCYFIYTRTAAVMSYPLSMNFYSVLRRHRFAQCASNVGAQNGVRLRRPFILHLDPATFETVRLEKIGILFIVVLGILFRVFLGLHGHVFLWLQGHVFLGLQGHVFLCFSLRLAALARGGMGLKSGKGRI